MAKTGGRGNGGYQPAPLPLLPIWQAETTPDQQLRITGPALFSGALVRENDHWIYQPHASGWYLTDDRVALENRFLIPMGRADSRVKVLGELVDPENIERELAALSDGRLAPGMFAVVAVPDARAGHALVPVFDAAADPALMAAVLASFAAQAPGFRRLRPAVRLADFPRSPLGKPRRAAPRSPRPSPNPGDEFHPPGGFPPLRVRRPTGHERAETHARATGRAFHRRLTLESLKQRICCR